MGRVIVEQVVSVDGYTSDRNGGLDYFGSAGGFLETQDEQMEMMAGVDAIIFGANTYRRRPSTPFPSTSLLQRSTRLRGVSTRQR
jgi:hypothetical protein